MPQEESKFNELSKLFVINCLLSYNQPSSDWTYAEMWGWKPYSLQMSELEVQHHHLDNHRLQALRGATFEQMPRSQKKQISFQLNRLMDFFSSYENWTMLIEKDK